MTVNEEERLLSTKYTEIIAYAYSPGSGGGGGRDTCLFYSWTSKLGNFMLHMLVPPA